MENTRYAWCIWRLKTAFNLEIRDSEVEKQDTKYEWFISRLKCNKQYALTAFRAWDAQSKALLKYLEVLKYQERLNDIKKGRKDNFRGSKTLSKSKPMYLEVKLKEAKFGWCV